MKAQDVKLALFDKEGVCWDDLSFLQDAIRKGL